MNACAFWYIFCYNMQIYLILEKIKVYCSDYEMEIVHNYFRTESRLTTNTNTAKGNVTKR